MQSNDSLEAVRAALQPVIDWFQPDDRPERPLADIIRDAVAELQSDRKELLLLRRIRGEAEAAATRRLPDSSNPYPDGSREYCQWQNSYWAERAHRERINVLCALFRVESPHDIPNGDHDAGKLVAESMTEVSEMARQMLRELMSEISEAAYFAGWLDGLEYDLWGMAYHEKPPYHAGDEGEPTPNEAELARLRRLSVLAGGWWTFEEFVTAAEWRARYAAKVGPTP